MSEVSTEDFANYKRHTKQVEKNSQKLKREVKTARGLLVILKEAAKAYKKVHSAPIQLIDGRIVTDEHSATLSDAIAQVEKHLAGGQYVNR